MLHYWIKAVALLAVVTLPTQAASDEVKLQQHVPDGASKVIDHAFAGVAMKSFSWPEFTHPFSQNLYNALARRTGTDVIIRLGGTGM